MPLRLIALASLSLTVAAFAPHAQTAGDDAPHLSSAACTTAGQRIDEEGYVTIGGIEQWVQVKGDSCSNPVILHVHGGPGNPETPYTDHMYKEWERDYTIVQWDQRGSGLTFARNKLTDDVPLRIEQLRDDGIEVAHWAMKRFQRRQVILMGSSWGSALSVFMVKASPASFCAYVGTSQIVSEAAMQRPSYEAAMALARAAGDHDSIAKLDALGPPPWTNPRNPGILRRVLRKYEATSTDPIPKSWMTPSSARYTSAQYETNYTAGEDYSWLQFVGWKGDGIASRLDFYKLGPEFGMPVYMLQGAQDLLTMPASTRPYFDSIEAPRKAYVLVPRAGHDPNPPMLAAQFKVLRENVGECR
ncbi:alpha/beta fold hydrolase [Massilia sp. 9096]|uniref:alpha/beta fold hydrolase n=1 Tax=Massilia sp. 9096 TaxID=1500894 RepID=UPI0009DEC849|nr:alpha/beta hydrolase [Massilia sp. 9096]